MRLDATNHGTNNMLFPSTLLIRNTKKRPKIGAPLALNYRNNVFDPTCHLEAMIEAYGAHNVTTMVKLIEARRQDEYAQFPDHFRKVAV